MTGDWILAVLVVAAGLLALSPLSGLAAARETVTARRRQRALFAEFRAAGSEIWARQARRNAVAAARRHRSIREP